MRLPAPKSASEKLAFVAASVSERTQDPLAHARGHRLQRSRSARSARTRNSKPETRDPESSGFTLLELLLATAVAAVVLIVIQTTFFGALRLHNTTHARIDEDVEVQRALTIIRRDFAGLMMPGGMLSGQLQTTTFSSTVGEDFGERVSPDIFTNSGRIDGWNPFSEVQKVAYFLGTPTSSAAGKDLVRVVTRNLLPVQEIPGEPEVLLHGIEEAVVEFCDGTGWTPDWDSEVTSALPTAFKLRLTFARKEVNQPAPEPLELVVPVFVTTSASARAALAHLPEEVLP